jgi:putative tricarboxylic transport membrane protein
MSATGAQRRPLHPGELIIALGLVALGAFVLWETRSIAETQGYAQVGPRLFPYIVGAGMALCGAVLAFHAVSGGWRNVPLDQPGHDEPDWKAFVTISAGIVAHMILIGYVGFVIAGTVLFVLIARGFGSTRLVRDVLIAVVLCAVVYVVFTYGLSLKLPGLPFLKG